MHTHTPEPDDTSAAAKGGLALTVASIAEEVARLYALYDRMEAGEWAEGNLGIASTTEPLVDFDARRKLADRRIHALEAVLLQLKPTNVDEALWLLLVTSTLFSGWSGDAYEGREVPPRAENEALTIEHALASVARFLHRDGARSPLIRDHFVEGQLAPAAEQVDAALAARPSWRRGLRCAASPNRARG
jgi:hypothetical protein